MPPTTTSSKVLSRPRMSSTRASPSSETASTAGTTLNHVAPSPSNWAMVASGPTSSAPST